MRISFINGLMVAGDAISNSVKDKVRAVTEHSRETGVPLDARVFLCGTDARDERVSVVRGVNDIVSHGHFLSSDIVIYDFGIYYELFNSIFLAPPAARKFVHFHNITPAELVPERERETIEKSYSQLANVFAADHIIAGSPYNRDTLLKFGVSGDRITILDYSIDFPDGSREGRIKIKERGPARLLYIGRFVPSKGVLDLLKAVKMALDKGFSGFRLDLIGNETFSDKAYMEAIKAFIAENGIGEFVDFRGTVTDEERRVYYERAHALVMPSYHEGFCVPVVEAYNHGCFVISYDAGNLHNLVSGFGCVVKTGDVEGLSESIVRFCSRKSGDRIVADAGSFDEDEYARTVVGYSDTFSFARFKDRFIKILDMGIHATG
ncbi:MAG: glycosyltransferase family 4 protein [Deltaproteobacteria bacterium]|nr:glycosyltransferase family 4 protein [Deltaproteobacteria bacterium]